MYSALSFLKRNGHCNGNVGVVQIVNTGKSEIQQTEILYKCINQGSQLVGLAGGIMDGRCLCAVINLIDTAFNHYVYNQLLLGNTFTVL